MEEFDRALGERLRAARRRRGWSLHEVEAMSGKEFKASVLGAYERGERSLSVQRLQRLAGIYGVGVAQLIPPDSDGQAQEGGGELLVDLEALEQVDLISAEAIDRFLAAIQLRRKGSATSAVRRADLELLTALVASDPAALERLIRPDQEG